MSYKIAITGEFRRGKDTLANLIIEQIREDKTQNVTRLEFADALKRELAEMTFEYVRNSFGLSVDYDTVDTPEYLSVLDEWDEKLRRDKRLNGLAFQWWGEWRRQTFGQDYWLTHPTFLGNYARACDHEHHILVTDMRHHNEAQWCREHGFYLIRIEGPCQVEGELRDAKHPSEVHVPDLPVHLVIQNTGGLDALREKVASELMTKLERFFNASIPG